LKALLHLLEEEADGGAEAVSGENELKVLLR